MRKKKSPSFVRVKAEEANTSKPAQQEMTRRIKKKKCIYQHFYAYAASARQHKKSIAHHRTRCPYQFVFLLILLLFYPQRCRLWCSVALNNVGDRWCCRQLFSCLPRWAIHVAQRQQHMKREIVHQKGKYDGWNNVLPQTHGPVRLIFVDVERSAVVAAAASARHDRHEPSC